MTSKSRTRRKASSLIAAPMLSAESTISYSSAPTIPIPSNTSTWRMSSCSSNPPSSYANLPYRLIFRNASSMRSNLANFQPSPPKFWRSPPTARLGIFSSASLRLYRELWLFHLNKSLILTPRIVSQFKRSTKKRFYTEVENLSDYTTWQKRRVNRLPSARKRLR